MELRLFASLLAWRNYETAICVSYHMQLCRPIAARAISADLLPNWVL